MNENDILKIEQLKNENDRLSSELDAAKQTIARQTQQIEDLKSGLGSGLDSLPKEVREDAQQRPVLQADGRRARLAQDL